MKRLPLLAAAAFLPTLACAAPVEVSELSASAKRGDDGRWVLTVTGQAKGAPADASVAVWLDQRKDHGQATGVATLSEGRFSLELGADHRKLLPGTYRLTVEVAGGTGTAQAQVGEAAEVEHERVMIRQEYDSLLQAVYLIYRGLGTWGGAIASHSATAKEVYKGKVPNQLASRITREWSKYSQVFHRDLPAIRFDHQQFVGLFVHSYYPEADAKLSEVFDLLEHWRTAITATIFGNLGLPVPKSLSEEAKNVAPEKVRDEIRAKAREIRKLVGLEDQDWEVVVAGTPERAEDIKGDVFTSSVSGFTIRKPGEDWFFNTGARNPSMRLRIMYKKRLAGPLLSGVEVRSYPLAHSASQVIRIDENQTRNRWPGFELVSSKPLSLDDPGAPGGKRVGRLIHYRMQSGSRRIYIVQYALVGRHNKRLFCVMSFLGEALLKEWLPVIERINASFQIHDGS